MGDFERVTLLSKRMVARENSAIIVHSLGTPRAFSAYCFVLPFENAHAL